MNRGFSMRKITGKKSAIIIIAIMFCSTWVQGQTKLTIQKALEIAETNSPQLRKSRMNLERFEENLFAQKASLKSKFSLDLSPIEYNNNRVFDSRLSEWYTNESFNTGGSFKIAQPILLTDGTISLVNSFGWQDSKSSVNDLTNQSFNNNLYLELSQPIFTYNTRKMALKEIELDYENAYINHALQLLNTEMQITNQFYSVYTAQNNLLISKEELKNAQQSHEIIQNKVDADLAARDELFQADLNLSTAVSSVDNRQVSLENTKDKLKQTLGMDIDEEIFIIAGIEINEVTVNIDKAISHGLDSRLELRQKEIEQENLAFAMIKTRAIDEFKGNVALSFGLVGDNEKFSDIYDTPTKNPRVSIRFSVPIFDWGERKARIKAQEIAQDISNLDFEEERIDITLSIRQVCRSIKNLYSQIQIADQNVENAQLTYDLNQERYRNGDLTGMQMNDFQNQLSNAKIAHSQSKINYKVEILNLKILSLYDFESDQPIVPMAKLDIYKKKK